MASWLNGNVNKCEGVVKVDVGAHWGKTIDTVIKKLYKENMIPKDAVVVSTEQNKKFIRVKYVKNYTDNETIFGKHPKREVMIRASLEEMPVVKKELEKIKNLKITGEETTDKYYRVRYVVL